MRWKNAVGVIVALGLLSNPAVACKGTRVLFQDTFMTADAGWDIGLEIGDGAAKLKPSDEDVPILYRERRFGDADICVSIAIPSDADFDQFGSFVFWALDELLYYALVIKPD